MPTRKPASIVPLRRKSGPPSLPSVELFSGCGGLALGLSHAGFSHELLVEKNGPACQTLSHNRSKKTAHVSRWNVRVDDVREVDWTCFSGDLALVAGGPPCQPFSMGGKAAGNEDARDMWPESVRAVRETMPEAFLFENVKGLLRPRFADYVDWIRHCLAHPHMPRADGESHTKHLVRMRKADGDAEYHVQVISLNAADYGAPQKRHRVFFIGFRKDSFAEQPSFPLPTHSQDRLIWDKWVTGEYWSRHGLSRPDDSLISSLEKKIVVRLRGQDARPLGEPWRTCRDAFDGLGEPGISHDILNHRFQDGARVYPGHTGSPIDEPSKALKAGVHGVPGGENMLLREDGTVRYFSIREAARLQGFPDDFEFPGSWSESMRQLGNAVPVHLSTAVGQWVASHLRQESRSKRRA